MPSGCMNIVKTCLTGVFLAWLYANHLLRNTLKGPRLISLAGSLVYSPAYLEVMCMKVSSHKTFRPVLMGNDFFFVLSEMFWNASNILFVFHLFGIVSTSFAMGDEEYWGIFLCIGSTKLILFDSLIRNSSNKLIGTVHNIMICTLNYIPFLLRKRKHSKFYSAFLETRDWSTITRTSIIHTFQNPYFQ